MLLKTSKWRANLSDTVSLCMIMKNEAKRLDRCLDSVQGVFSEIVIVDTGSTDRSREIAVGRGCRVFDDPWDDDFARPRNVGLDQAKGHWIFVLDPDEVLDVRDHHYIRRHTLHPELISLRMDTRNYTDNPWQQGCRPNPGDFIQAKKFYGFVPSTKTRMFQNGKGLRFRGCWHELVDYDISDHKYPFGQSPVQVHHYPGEIVQADLEEKKRFYLRLGEKKVRLAPDDDQAWWELAVAEHICGLNDRAFQSVLMSFRRGFYVPDRLFFLAAVAKATGHDDARKIAFEKAICMIFPSLTHVEPKARIPMHVAPAAPKKPVISLHGSLSP